MRTLLAVIPGVFLAFVSACGTQTSVPDPYVQAAAGKQVCVDMEMTPPELTRRPGYHQLTISVERHADGTGVLSRGDLRLSVGKTDLPIEYFRQEPASVGILVDTSASMELKLDQTRTAITQFINDLSPRNRGIFSRVFDGATRASTSHPESSASDPAPQPAARLWCYFPSTMRSRLD